MLIYHYIRNSVVQIVTNIIKNPFERAAIEMRFTDFLDDRNITYGAINDSIFLSKTDFEQYKLEIGRIFIIKLETIEA
jgi:hypothetical protein